MTWQPIETAPTDGTPILAFCVAEADPGIVEPGGTEITPYAAWTEVESPVSNGPCVVEWLDDFPTEDESGEGWGPFTAMPGCWFRLNSDPPQPANPLVWLPIPNFDYSKKDQDRG